MDYQYPIGKPQVPTQIETEHIRAWIEEMAHAPEALVQAVAGLTDEQLDTPYRPDGWTVRQLVHHMPDSHMSAYLNFRMGLCSEDPPLRSGDVNGWAQTGDYQVGDTGPSLQLFAGLQRRWVALMRTMEREDFERTLITATGAKRRLATILRIYAWHCNHHVAHITELRARQGW